MYEEFVAELKFIRAHTKERDKAYNIFSVLHNKFDERRLHSRFISSLLNPQGSHKQGNKFLKIFLEALNIRNFDINDVNVYPTEDEKSEWKNVDIYVKNATRAVIIENKIFAGDSNKKMEDEQEKAQLLNYYEKVKNDLNLNDKLANENILLVYLTLNGKNPSLVHQLNERNISLRLIDYIQFIPAWLTECIKDLPIGSLQDSIAQYLNLVKSITNDFELTMKLRELLVRHINEAHSIIYTNPTENNDEVAFLSEEFRHVKWHTVHEFWHDLANYLAQHLNAVKINVPKDDLITTITHKKVKRNLVLDFEYDGKLIYIANDAKGFTWGIIFMSENERQNFESLYDNKFNIEEDKAWKNFDDLPKIVFSDFQNIKTFELIQSDEREKVIEKISSTILKNLKTIK